LEQSTPTSTAEPLGASENVLDTTVPATTTPPEPVVSPEPVATLASATDANLELAKQAVQAADELASEQERLEQIERKRMEREMERVQRRNKRTSTKDDGERRRSWLVETASSLLSPTKYDSLPLILAIGFLFFAFFCVTSISCDADFVFCI
jgi:hypothetical protein